MNIKIAEQGLALVIGTNDKGAARLLYLGREESLPAKLPAPDGDHHLLLIQSDKGGKRNYEKWGAKQFISSPGIDFAYVAHREVKNELGRKVEMDLMADPLTATVHWQFYTGVPVIRTWVDVHNQGKESVGLEHVASFVLPDLSRPGKKLWHEKSRLYTCANSWCYEARWRGADIRDYGLDRARDFSSGRLKFGNTGNWSTKDHLPMGIYENTETHEVTFWQIENNGSWSWEIGDNANHLYLTAQGPNEPDNHWYHVLKPGASFRSVSAAIGFAAGGFSEAIGALTSYRRRILHPHWDHEKLPVIFNDYMNCLMGDPTTERELPYLKAAQKMGAEIFVIDAGWYATRGESWWTSVGAWQPSPDRFTGGIHAMLKAIRDHGMVPGLWLELEVMGVDCPLVSTWPAECFFRRHGQPVINRGRYQLDFRHPIVTAHSDKVIDRLVNEYGAGFIKMDYNIDAGIGSEVDADSFGDGLLQHNRAYLTWLDAVFARHPKLIIENCSSGGMRMDYALLSRHSIQSITDQEDVVMLARIAAMGPTAAVPEQVGVWVYPKKEDSDEKVILNCVNGLTSRFYLSGEIAFLKPEQLQLVREAVDFHRGIRDRIRTGIPFWPLGPVHHESKVAALGLKTETGLLLTVWNFSEEALTVALPLPVKLPASCIVSTYPKKLSDGIWHLKDGGVTVQLPAGPCGRVALLAWK